MKTRYIVLLSLSILLIASAFLMVQSALASTPTGTCGEGVTSKDPTQTIAIKKWVNCSGERDWTWTIKKLVSEASLTLSPGQTHTVNYTVEVSASSVDNLAIDGTIRIQNLSLTQDVYLTSLTDSLPVTIVCWLYEPTNTKTFPMTLPANTTMDCTYSGSLASAAGKNEATVTFGTDQSVTASVNIDWSKGATETDKCIDVSDTFMGALGQVCAGQSPKTFTYSRLIGPYEVCGDYTVDNTASFVAIDSGKTGSSSQTVKVNVPCAGGCTLTPGYWKTHSTYGPAPYDDTWAQIGENTPFFLSGKSYYQVLWTPPLGNAYYILAHAFIAAKLNGLNGADTSAVSGALAFAEGFFSSKTPTTSLTRAERAEALMYATMLDMYNNGYIGPGHCSE